MDAEIKQEFDKINKKINKIGTKLERSTKDSSLMTFAVVGFSIFIMGIAIWVQERMFTSEGTFFVVYGGMITVSMYLTQKKIFTKTAKWLVPTAAIILLGVFEVIKYILTNAVG